MISRFRFTVRFKLGPNGWIWNNLDSDCNEYNMRNYLWIIIKYPPYLFLCNTERLKPSHIGALMVNICLMSLEVQIISSIVNIWHLWKVKLSFTSKDIVLNNSYIIHSYLNGRGHCTDFLSLMVSQCCIHVGLNTTCTTCEKVTLCWQLARWFPSKTSHFHPYLLYWLGSKWKGGSYGQAVKDAYL